jgi:hypothetical protein
VSTNAAPQQLTKSLSIRDLQQSFDDGLRPLKNPGLTLASLRSAHEPNSPERSQLSSGYPAGGLESPLQPLNVGFLALHRLIRLRSNEASMEPSIKLCASCKGLPLPVLACHLSRR